MLEIDHYLDESGRFDGRYLLLRKLSSEGGTADVWLAEDKATEDEELSDDNGEDIVKVEGSAVLVAIKIYRPKNMLDVEGIQTFKKEYKTVFNCRHENLLKPTGFSIIDESIPYLVMPFCEKGSMEKMLGKLTNEDELWKFIYDTASGLSYLHSCNPPIVHQDIKPANILIDDNNNYCITDFGISAKTGKDADLETEYYGTIIYMAPECFKKGHKPMPQSDVWSLGATIYELVTGDVPFGDDGGDAQNAGKGIPEIKTKIPGKIKKLVYTCLDPRPENRPTADALVEFARNKGKRRFIYYSPLLLFPVVAAAIITSLYLLGDDKADPFVSLCLRGDSVLKIEKKDAEMKGPVEFMLAARRIEEAKSFYEQAQKIRHDKGSKGDSLTVRIERMQQLQPMLKSYRSICASLQMAIDDEAEIAVLEYEKKRDSMSNIIKSAILGL